MIWINGRLVEPDDATVAYNDHGLVVGDGVFETIKMDHGQPFALTRHLKRLQHCAAVMGIPEPHETVLRTAVAQVCSSHTGNDGFLRITLTAGPAPLGTPRQELSPTLIVAIRPGAVRVEPTACELSPWTRNENGALAGVKSTSYGENVVALALAATTGASESLFANTAGELCEGTGSNIFVVVDDELVTPPLSSGCLAGVTRELLLEHGVGIERTVDMSTIAQWSEAFLVSTGREVQPIERIGHHLLSTEHNPHTREAAHCWQSQIVHHLDP